ncbi:hypothetical protein WJX73_003065 [Symbiochloris irregularis]|uniref:Fructose-bisphosphatase n=1 Tax=Symbiochloris irregularis TaxID=706552 RepID=A0AAW1P6S7_9CHLO
MARALRDHFPELPDGLATTLQAIADAVAEISVVMRTVSCTETGGLNNFGDKQLQADIVADRIVFERLRSSGAVSTASSEEQSDMISLGGTGYSVAFDPLDGSSIISANFAVGSIFGIWEGDKLLGQQAGSQVAAAYSLYGPKTLLVIALRTGHSGSSSSSKVFAPANLRATRENHAYRELVTDWMEKGYTLRYSGGMVPDVHHILAKGGGIFCSPAAPSAPAKLRMLYDAAALVAGLSVAPSVAHAAGASGGEVGGYLPKAGIDDLVQFIPDAKKTPSLRAGSIDPTTPYKFAVPPTWKEEKIANIQSGNFCAPRCDEPWTEVIFINPAEGKAQLIVAPLRRLTPKSKASIDQIGDPNGVMAAIGPYLTGTGPPEEEEILKAEKETRDGRTYYVYEANTSAGPTGPHILTAATTKGDNAYILIVSANERQWSKSQSKLRKVVQSFTA